MCLNQATSNPSPGSSPAKKDPNALQVTPLEKYLLDVPLGPSRDNGSDKFWGLENVSLRLHGLYEAADSVVTVRKYMVYVIVIGARTPN